MRKIIAITFVALLITPSVRGQFLAPSPPSPMRSTGDQAKLKFFEGNWTVDDSLGQTETTRVCAWLPSSRTHMVCRTNWKHGGERRESLGVISYDSTNRNYAYHVFGPPGDFGVSRGGPTPAGWQFGSERQTSQMLGRVRTRYETTPQGNIRVIAESAVDADPWSLNYEQLFRRVPEAK